MKKTILLHICCGPCSIMPIVRLLEQDFTIIPWFMNPNIQPFTEYSRRRENVEKCLAHFGLTGQYDDKSWNIVEWITAQQPRLRAVSRCLWCCATRLEAASARARNVKADFFSTTLLYSIYQPHDYIRIYGEYLAGRDGMPFLYMDFRTDWKKGQQLAREWELYMQPYCGCVFSEAERYAKKLKKLIASNSR